MILIGCIEKKQAIISILILVIDFVARFASRTDNEGEYYLKASLLDSDKREIPGYTFDSHVNIAASDEWEKEDYTFFPVPDTARYVRFEDGGKDEKYWAGQYGVKMIGAVVYAGQKHEYLMEKEFSVMVDDLNNVTF